MAATLIGVSVGAGVLLAGCGSAGSSGSQAVAAQQMPAPAGSSGPTTSSGAAPSAAPSAGAASTDYSNIPGMAMGAPPQTSSVTCSGNSCDVIFIPPSDETARPLGLAVRLTDSTASQVVISVGGKSYVIKPGKPVQVQGVTVSLTGTPGAVVNLNFRKGA